MRAARNQKLTWFAMELLAPTFVRTAEIIGARWDEIDFDQKVWSIPAERMKKKRPHYVPLAKQAITLLTELNAITGERKLIFPQWGNVRSRK